MRTQYFTTEKNESHVLNEDAIRAGANFIAVSDGAGGGGLFAEKWSGYLLQHLPDSPIESADALDAWIGDIWEPFYNQCEQEAQQMKSLSLEKFYEEGSFATLAAVWKVAPHQCRWITYGDSVAFCYNRQTKILEHSFGRLADFNRPPYLINCKDELDKQGFRQGFFTTNEHSLVFVASDALAHYLIASYECIHPDYFADELTEALTSGHKQAQFIQMIQARQAKDFYKNILAPLCRKIHKRQLKKFLYRLEREKLLAHDDYSFALMDKLASTPLPRR